MRFIRIIVFTILFFCYCLNTYSTILSDRAKISLITIAPGKDLYSSFGHSAFWVYDPETGFDRIYNYGTFDFDEPNFYVKFIRGKLLYRLSISDMEGLLYGAKYENRAVREQILDLDSIGKDDLFKFLENNYLPENRYYKYDFFLDNCSTRLRDALKKIYGDSLQFHMQVEDKKSFRQLLDPFLLDKQWQDIGMDIGLGTPADKIASPYEYMYLPEFLMKGFASATLKSGGVEKPLVKNSKVLFQPAVIETNNINADAGPQLFFWSLLGVILLYSLYKMKGRYHAAFLDSILLTFSGLLGILLIFLWFGTDHYVTKNNWNLIWANPLNLLATLLLLRKDHAKILRIYLFIYASLVIMLLLAWNVIPQELNLATFPVILLLAIRAMIASFQLKKMYS